MKKIIGLIIAFLGGSIVAFILNQTRKLERNQQARDQVAKADYGCMLNVEYEEKVKKVEKEIKDASTEEIKKKWKERFGRKG